MATRAPAPEISFIDEEFEPIEVAATIEPLPVTIPEPAAPKEPREPLVSRRVMALTAAAVAIIAVVGAGAYYLLTSGVIDTARQKVAAIATPAPPADNPASTKTTGSLRVSSTPAGARVLVDGRARGVTPLTLDDLTLGTHTVILESSQGTVQRTVDVTAERPATLDESIFAGWVAVYAPIELTIADGTRSVRTDDRGEIMLAAGRHTLRFANRALGFEEIVNVDVKPGERQRVTIAPPRSTITVTASEPAEVWVDGTRLGDTPLTAAPINIGTHELLVKRAGGGERRSTITVTVKPFSTSIEF